MYECFAYMFTACRFGACREQKRESGSLKLELEIVVSYHVGTGNQTWDFWKNSEC